jgi:ribosomal protein S18 acetylase RimI-like enzyme
MNAPTNNDKIKLRDYRASDIPQMLIVIKQAFAEYHGQLDPPSSAERKTIDILTAELNRSDALVIETDDKIVGCVLFRPRDEGIYFERLSILPAYRNRGLGHLMLNEIEARALQSGETVIWFSVRLELTRLQDFYKDIGYVFQEYGTHTGYTEPTYMKMRKVLIPAAT